MAGPAVLSATKLDFAFVLANLHRERKYLIQSLHHHGAGSDGLAAEINVNEEQRELFRSLRATKIQVLRKLVLPDAVPLIIAGLRLALTTALSCARVTEFIQRHQGIGSRSVTNQMSIQKQSESTVETTSEAPVSRCFPNL